MVTEDKMKFLKGILVLLGFSLIAGCTSTHKEGTIPAAKTENPTMSNAPDARASETRAALDYKRLGLRLIHSPTGQIEALEATGYAPILSLSQSAIREAYRVAELEAKKSVNDFINDETITSGVTVTMISRNIDKSIDKRDTANLERDDTVEALTTDEEVDSPLANTKGTSSTDLKRSDAVKIATELKTTITLNNKGILSGLYLVSSEIVDDGKNVRATYRWDRQGNQAKRQLRDVMKR